MISQKYFQIYLAVHVHLETDKVDLKKKATVKKNLNVECYKDFFGYFNALKTNFANSAEAVKITNNFDILLFVCSILFDIL